MPSDSMVFDYQLVLNVLEWLPVATRAEFDMVVRTLVTMARVTLLELPNPDDPAVVGAHRLRREIERARDIYIYIYRDRQTDRQTDR